MLEIKVFYEAHFCDWSYGLCVIEMNGGQIIGLPILF